MIKKAIGATVLGAMALLAAPAAQAMYVEPTEQLRALLISTDGRLVSSTNSAALASTGAVVMVKVK
jgi:thiamine biosynthesis lipoprotein ApbE